MVAIIRPCSGTISRLFRSRRTLLLENLASRQQLVVFKRRHPRPRLGSLDKFFWLMARRIRSEWKNSLIIVTPETVVGWHRAGFRLYWKLISRVRAPGGGFINANVSTSPAVTFGAVQNQFESASGTNTVFLSRRRSGGFWGTYWRARGRRRRNRLRQQHAE